MGWSFFEREMGQRQRWFQPHCSHVWLLHLLFISLPTSVPPSCVLLAVLSPWLSPYHSPSPSFSRLCSVSFLPVVPAVIQPSHRVKPFNPLPKWWLAGCPTTHTQSSGWWFPVSGHHTPPAQHRPPDGHGYGSNSGSASMTDQICFHENSLTAGKSYRTPDRPCYWISARTHSALPLLAQSD